MSVVVAVVNDNKITVAADSGVYSGWSITPVKDVKISKLEKINDMILGGVGYAEENLLLFDYMKTHVLDVVDPEHIRQFIKEFLKYKEELLTDLNTLLSFESVDSVKDDECEKALDFVLKKAKAQERGHCIFI